MKIALLTPRKHALVDYLAALGLIALPFLLDLESTSQTALWLSVVAGAGLITYSLLTDYALGVFKLIPFRIHLWLDLAAALVFISAPFVLEWTGLTAAYYFIMAAAVIVVVVLTSSADPIQDR